MFKRVREIIQVILVIGIGLAVVVFFGFLSVKIILSMIY